MIERSTSPPSGQLEELNLFMYKIQKSIKLWSCDYLATRIDMMLSHGSLFKYDLTHFPESDHKSSKKLQMCHVMTIWLLFDSNDLFQAAIQNLIWPLKINLRMKRHSVDVCYRFFDHSVWMQTKLKVFVRLRAMFYFTQQTLQRVVNKHNVITNSRYSRGSRYRQKSKLVFY